jgi:CheY-like chemotaxis protein/CHASE3 domain sensor protein
MPSSTPIDPTTFKRMLRRNVVLPLGMGLLGAAGFTALIVYLLSVINWVEHTDRVIANAQEVARLNVEMESSMRGFLIAGDNRYLEPYEAARVRITGQTGALRELVADNPAQSDRLSRMQALQVEWAAYAEGLIAARRRNESTAEAVAAGRGRRLTDAMRGEFTRFVDTEQALRVERSADAHRITTLVLGLYLVFSIGFGALVAILGRRELTRLSATYEDSLQRQSAFAERLQHQAWLREGQTTLASEIIGRQDLASLGRQVLESIARQLGCAVGAMYARDDFGSLRRIAHYGFSRELSERLETVQDGETLVGQAARENRTLRLEQVPAGYLEVSSGLGHGSPLNAVLVPVTDEGAVNGVIELGFLRPVQARDIELLELVAPDIAGSLEAARYRQRQQDMLAETQQLNEELQVQQEELRTANEELEEQSRVLKESQANLENQQAELEQTNAHLAEQALALDQKNADLRHAQGALEERADELQRASRYKSEFLANMSHELRTPLNSSLILAKLLADNAQGNLNAEQVKFAESIYSAGNDLLNLINDILDISKVEAGKLDMRPQDVGVQKLVDALRMTFEPLAAQKQLDFRLEIAHGTPPSLRTDRQRVEQILKNLLSNALKFTSAGAVALSVAPHARGVAFSVRDSGIGIRQDQQQAIFDAFHQADGTTSRRYGGTGLGLTISRDLTHLLGGQLTVESAPGQGSTFTLVMPLAYEPPLLAQPLPAPAQGTGTAAPAAAPLRSPPAAQGAAAPAPTATAGSGAGGAPAWPRPPAMPPAPVPAPVPAPAAHRQVPAPAFQDDRSTRPFGDRAVLVIEDEPKFAHILYDLAHELEYNCLVAHGAADGFSLAAQFMPDAILLDMGLPDGPGLAVLQKLKENPETRHIPVHVISAEDRSEAALHMGAIGYAIKPTSREQLKDVFRKLGDKLAQKVKRILLVEDDARQRESIVHLIGDDDIEITAVESGGEALDLLRSQIFDCMIIDLKLPDMDGDELLKRMSTEEICSFPPVIVYTGRNLTRDEEANLLRYSRSIIIKGARSPERLLDEVTLFLHKVESELSTERQKMLQAARSRDKVFEGRKILLVDDDVRNIFALTSALEHRGAIVEIGRNGREALERLAAVPDIDMVLMDVMMPEMDGLEATRELRKNPAWQKLPVIAVTAKAMKDDQEQCLRAGASDYLAKPIDLDRLFSLLRVWMPQIERSPG